MIPPRSRRLRPDELYWHTIAIGLTALVTNTLENDLPLYQAQLTSNITSLSKWMEGLQPFLQKLVRHYRQRPFGDAVCHAVERRILRAVRARAHGLPFPIPDVVAFSRNGRRVLNLEVPKCDGRLEPSLASS